MPIKLTALEDYAIENSTFAVDVNFKDSEGTPLIPSSITWSLMHINKSIINSREDVVVTPASEITIILSGADLAISAAELNVTTTIKRILLVEAIYNSSLGTGLPLVDQCEFYISNLDGV